MSDKQYRPSDDIPLPTNFFELQEFAKRWIDTAAQHLGNEEYWRKRAYRAEATIKLGQLRKRRAK